jgi:hypothetical protein
MLGGMMKRMKLGGRQAGTPNKITTAFKDAVRFVYDEIGGHAAFSDWAKDNQTEFYRIASRLIPTEMTQHSTGITVIINRGVRSVDAMAIDADIIDHQ